MTKVLLSTDIGSDIDDALALLAMINSDMDLRGIYTVNGDVRTRAYIAKHVVDLSGKSIDVAVGEAEPLGGEIRPYSHLEEYHIFDDKYVDKESSEESGKTIYKLIEKVGIKPKGLEDLAEKLSQEKHEIFSIGPMTNIAKLMEKYPEVIKNINRLYIMGCRFADDTLEHNVHFDVPAAIKVLGSDIPITVIPGDLCERYKMPVNQLEQLTTPAGLYVKRMAKGFLAIKTARAFAEDLADMIDKLKFGVNYVKKNPRETKKKEIEIKDKLLVNLDDFYYGALDPEKYFEQYHQLIEHLRNPKFNYSRGDYFARIMGLAIPKDLLIADVYVPFCFLNIDRIKTKRVTVQIGNGGISRRTKENKHTVVTDLDFDHFKDFLRKYLK